MSWTRCVSVTATGSLNQAERSPFLQFDPQHIAWLSQEIDNLRTALRWSIDSEHLGPALRLATAAGAFWYQRGFYSEGRVWYAEALAASEMAAATPERRFVMGWAAHLASKQGDFAAAQALNAEALVLARQLEDTSGIADALYQDGCTANRLGDLDRAQSRLEEALKLRRGAAPGPGDV